MFRPRSRNHDQRPAAAIAFVAWRVFWAGVLLVHLVALRSLVGTFVAGAPAELASELIRGAGLAIGILFCGLKLLDASFLRLKPGWRSTVSAGVALALLHVGVLDHSPGNDAPVLPTQVGVVLFVGTFVDLRLLGAFVRRRLSTRLPRPRRLDAHVHLNPYLRAYEAAFEPVRLLFEPRTVAPRAPPSFA